MSKLTVEVLQRDINRGVRNCSERCAIAVALRRASKDRHACVGSTDVRYKRLDVMLPSEAVAWVKLYDSDQPVEPFTFELDTDVPWVGMDEDDDE